MTIIKKAAGILGFTAAATIAIPLAMADGDPAAGEKIYKKCKVCHYVDKKKNRVGPNLVGLFGRAAGTDETYGKKYSKAMKESDVVWDEATLDQYLADPKGYIPKNKMSFKGLKKEEDRANVIAYLKEATAE